jgi:transposase-like protein
MVLDRFYEEILPIIGSTPIDSINFLKEKGLLRNTMKCLHCNFEMQWITRRGNVDGFAWKCNNRRCEKVTTTRSIRSNSFLSNTLCELRRIIHAIYLWCEEIPQTKVILQTGLSKQTVIIIYNFLRLVCKRYFELYPPRFGGNSVVCQIDESLFSHKPKYNRGRSPSRQTWVFGIVDTSYSPALGYLTIVDDRTSSTLFPIIAAICKPGTTVYSDEWSSYRRIQQELGFTHLTVKHKESFYNRENGAHTQNMESFWAKQKRRIRIMKRVRPDVMECYLKEFMWREFFRNNIFERIWECISVFMAHEE